MIKIDDFEYFFEWYNKMINTTDYEFIHIGCLGAGVYNVKKKEALIFEKDQIMRYKVVNQFSKDLAFGSKAYKKEDFRYALEEFMEIEKGYLEYVLGNYYDLSYSDSINIYSFDKKNKQTQKNKLHK